MKKNECFYLFQYIRNKIISNNPNFFVDWVSFLQVFLLFWDLKYLKQERFCFVLLKLHYEQDFLRIADKYLKKIIKVFFI